MSENARFFFVLGPARSGTTLFQRLFCLMDNVVCLNETCTDPLHFEQYMLSQRNRALGGQPVDTRDAEENLGSLVTQRPVGKALADDFWLGHKGGMFWLYNLEPLLVSPIIRGNIFAIIRNPVDTIASWMQPKSIENIPLCRACEAGSGGYARWNGGAMVPGWPEDAQTAAERMAATWNGQAVLLMRLHHAFRMMVRYEDAVKNWDDLATSIANYFGCTYSKENLPKVKRIDPAARYGADVYAECNQAVRKFAPMAKAFGYDV